MAKAIEKIYINDTVGVPDGVQTHTHTHTHIIITVRLIILSHPGASLPAETSLKHTYTVGYSRLLHNV